MHFADMVFFWARSNPARTALIQPNMVLSYRELAEAIETVSQRIARYGFASEEPVAVSIHQPIHSLAVCLALLRNGISVVPVNPSVLPHLRAQDIYNLIFTGEGLMLSGGRNIRFEPSWLQRSPDSAVPRSAAVESLAERANVIFLMQREVGGLKKVVMPNDALAARMKWLPLVGEADYNRALIVPSISSPSGFCRVAVNLYAGRTACLAGTNAARLLMIRTFNIDALVCSSQQARELVESIADISQPVEALREIWIEPGDLSGELGRTIQTRLCRNIIAGYGSEESGRVTLAKFDTVAEVPEAVGFVLPHACVEVVDDDDAPLDFGKVGRIRCRLEFFERLTGDGLEKNLLSDRWWYSDDRGWLRNDGMLFVSR